MRSIKIVSLCGLLLFLTGCNSPVYNQTEKNVANATIDAQQKMQKSDLEGKPAAPLIVKQGPYVDKTPISLAREPRWLKNKIILRGDQLPFSYYSRMIVGGGGPHVLTNYQAGLDDTTKVSMNYSGTVKGALELLAAKSGYLYSINENTVYWQSFISKTFDVAFLPGSSDYMMGKNAGGGNISPVASGGATGSVAVSAIIDDSAASQFSNLKGTLSVWKDLESTVKQLLSPQGSVIVSESTTTVTVRDRPTNVDLVEKYIKNLNNNLAQQVLVKVQVLDVSLENDFNWGINWNAVKHALGSDFFLNMNTSTPISISSFSTPNSGQGIGVRGTGETMLTAVITALNQQGKTSVVTEPRVVCLNNQVCVMRIISQVGYLASVQTTSLAGSSSGAGASVTSQITPGNVVTGLTLYLLPKIFENKVYLQVNADISNNPTFQVISSATGVSSGSTVEPEAGASIIQVPTLRQKQFNQKSIIATGETMILSGFREMSNQANAQQLITSQALGGKAAQQLTHETIILITPIILHGSV